jgi:hypothetical protein
LTDIEWIGLHCRHAELHLSFLLPALDDRATELTVPQHYAE